MSHVVAKKVLELVISTGNRHVDVVFNEVWIKNVEYFLRSQGTSFLVSLQTILTLPILSCHSGIKE